MGVRAIQMLGGQVVYIDDGDGRITYVDEGIVEMRETFDYYGTILPQMVSKAIMQEQKMASSKMSREYIESTLLEGVLKNAEPIDATVDTRPLKGEKPEETYARLLEEMKLPVAERVKLTDARNAAALKEEKERDTSLDAETIRRAIETTLRGMGPAISVADVEGVIKTYFNAVKGVKSGRQPQITIEPSPNDPTELNIEITLPPQLEVANIGKGDLDLKGLKWVEVPREALKPKLVVDGVELEARDVLMTMDYGTKEMVSKYLDRVRGDDEPWW